MALPMARPWKHPKTGVYWLRKRVPDDLRTIVGLAEYKRTLKTKDPAEAKKVHAAMLAEHTNRFRAATGSFRRAFYRHRTEGSFAWSMGSRTDLFPQNLKFERPLNFSREQSSGLPGNTRDAIRRHLSPARSE